MSSNSISNYEREYNEMKMVLRGISHEMGNALTIMGYSIKMFEKSNDIEKNENWEYLNEDFEYICRLFKNLSEYNHSNTIKKNKIDLKALLQGIVHSYYQQCVESGIELGFTCEIDKAEIYGDEIGLRQVFINLIKNAYEAIILQDKKIKGKIDIVLEKDNNRYKVSLSDNGCGIEEEKLQKVFEPMYTYNKKNGTGFGLTVSRNIIYSHGGDISVTSKVNEGTTFVIMLDK